ncbi:MAG: glycosyltransferase family protein [Candidatus Pacebacteria bacterium]|nr:glycosyltransferase family protein [Candidatus Paceibacterota bacterium]
MTGIIIQARMGSTRLPGKMAKKILGKTILEHVIFRLQKIKNPAKIILATTISKKDNILESIAKKNKIKVFRGSEEDVLDRYYQAAKQFDIDPIVRITADCPVLDWQVCDEVINFYLENQFDYVSNVRPPTFPDGLDVEVFSFAALEKSWQAAKLKSEREHVVPYIVNHPEIFKIGNLVRNGNDLSDLRLTLDEKDDLILLKKIYSALYKKNNYFTLNDILKLFQKNPELLKINQKIKRNEGFLKSLREDK